MALTNLIVTVVGVTAAVLLLRSDVKQSASIFRRNVRHIRQWLEEESASASKFGFRLWAITDRHRLCLLCEDGIKYACWNRRVGGIRMWVGAVRMRKMLLMVVAAGVITDCGLREAVQGWRHQEISLRCRIGITVMEAGEKSKTGMPCFSQG